MEAAVKHNIQSFIFTSSTTVFGRANAIRKAENGELKAAYINENVLPIPKNIYGLLIK